MSGPDAADPRAETRVRAALQSFLQNGRGRSPVLLAIFALVLFAAGRGEPGVAPPVVREPAASGTPRFSEPRVLAAGTAAGPPLQEPATEALAVDNLLARYDALIRLLEARAIHGRAAAADSALAELRALRGRTYAAARRAVIASATAPDP